MEWFFGVVGLHSPDMSQLQLLADSDNLAISEGY